MSNLLGPEKKISISMSDARGVTEGLCLSRCFKIWLQITFVTKSDKQLQLLSVGNGNILYSKDKIPWLFGS